MRLAPDLIEKAKAAQSVEELIALAKENGMEITAEEAKEYFARLNPVRGGLSDEELDNVSGGGCYARDNRLSVSWIYFCEHFGHIDCGGDGIKLMTDKYGTSHVCAKCNFEPVSCRYCRYCSYEGGWWYCNHPANMKG